MELVKWKVGAIKIQDMHSSALNDRLYDRFTICQLNELKKKILGILFGPIPEDETKKMSSWDSWESLYKKEQIEKCHELMSLIRKNTVGEGSYDFAYIVVCVLFDNRSINVPVFRVRSNYKQESYNIADNVFIDHIGRVYKNWNAYLNENTWDMSWLCVPVDGYYSNYYNYNFIDQSERGKVVKVLNEVSTFANIASSLGAVGGAAMMLFPPTAPLGATVLTSSILAGAPSGVYGIGSGIHRLVDRSSHQQSIGLSDAESRSCWLNISAGAVGFASAGVTKGIAVAAGAGKAIPQSVRVISNTLTISSLSLAGTGIAVSIYDVSKKGWSNVTTFDFLQISTSILIFTHCAVSSKFANSIINEAQNSRLDSIKSNLGKKDALKIAKQTTSLIDKYGEINGKQQMILELKKIDNVPAFLSKWRIVAGEMKPAGTKFSPSSSSSAPTNVAPKQLLQLASSNNVLIGSRSIFNLNSFEAVRLNNILTQLGEAAAKIFFKLISTIQVRSLNHMHKLTQEFIEYIDKKISEWRIRDPNPILMSEVTVQRHYANEVLHSLKKEVMVDESMRRKSTTAQKVFSRAIMYDESSEEIEVPLAIKETEECIQGFVSEMSIFSEETYSKFVDDLVDDKENEKEWKQAKNFLSCTCTLTKTGETRLVEFLYDESLDTTYTIVKHAGEIKIFRIEPNHNNLIHLN